MKKYILLFGIIFIGCKEAKRTDCPIIDTVAIARSYNDDQSELDITYFYVYHGVLNANDTGTITSKSLYKKGDHTMITDKNSKDIVVEITTDAKILKN